MQGDIIRTLWGQAWAMTLCAVGTQRDSLRHEKQGHQKGANKMAHQVKALAR